MNNPKHRTPEHVAWRNMIARCKPGRHDADRYYSRGVRVCARWDPEQGGTFENFMEDMGPRPSSNHSLDKDGIKQGNLLYSPEFCRWADQSEQNTVRRNTVWLTHQGRTLCLQHWADLLGVKRSTLLRRLRMGWSVERTLETTVDSTSGRFKGGSITANGATHSIREWSKITGIKRATILWRLRNGYSPEKALGFDQDQPHSVVVAR